MYPPLFYFTPAPGRRSLFSPQSPPTVGMLYRPPVSSRAVRKRNTPHTQTLCLLAFGDPVRTRTEIHGRVTPTSLPIEIRDRIAQPDCAGCALRRAAFTGCSLVEVFHGGLRLCLNRWRAAPESNRHPPAALQEDLPLDRPYHPPPARGGLFVFITI